MAFLGMRFRKEASPGGHFVASGMLKQCFWSGFLSSNADVWTSITTNEHKYGVGTCWARNEKEVEDTRAQFITVQWTVMVYLRWWMNVVVVPTENLNNAIAVWSLLSLYHSQ